MIRKALNGLEKYLNAFLEGHERIERICKDLKGFESISKSSKGFERIRRVLKGFQRV